MKRVLRLSARWLDLRLAPLYVRRAVEPNTLLAFVFHALCQDEREGRDGLVHPRYAVSVSFLARFVAYFVEEGYTFVTPGAVAEGLPEGGRYALLTFDDGYTGVLDALPVLARYDVPAACYVCTAPIHSGEAFWWDVLYRERSRQGYTPAAIDAEIRAYARRPPAAVRSGLIGAFGVDALRPRGRVDRPLTPGALRRLAADPLMTIGNHTRDHAALRHRTPAERQAQILGAQSDLMALLGYAPATFAYPDGVFSEDVAAEVGRLGMTTAFTVEPRINRLPLDGPALLTLGRFSPRSGEDPIRQARLFRSGAGLMNGYLALGRRWRRHFPKPGEAG